MDALEVTYQIDSRGRIVSVGPGWDRFARVNNGAHLAGGAVLGRELWDFISDATTRALYRAMADRLGSDLPEISFTFRCDSPAERRLLKMRMRALPDDGIEFRVTPTTTVPRAPQSLLDPAAARSGDLLRMCSWCKRIPLSDQDWVEVEVAVQHLGWDQLSLIPGITHGICPTCEAEVFGLVNEPVSTTGHPVDLGRFE